jgi:hypothetical protein
LTRRFRNFIIKISSCGAAKPKICARASEKSPILSGISCLEIANLLSRWQYIAVLAFSPSVKKASSIAFSRIMLNFLSRFLLLKLSSSLAGAQASHERALGAG